jgi:hypothetical protein
VLGGCCNSQGGEFGLQTLQNIRIWLRLDLLRLEAGALIAFFVLAFPTLGVGRWIGRECRLTLVARIVRYRVWSELVTRIAVRVLIFLWPVVTDGVSGHSPEWPIGNSKHDGSRTYGSRGQSVQRTWLHDSHFLLPVMKSLLHSWQLRRIRWRGFLWTRSWPPVLLGRLRTTSLSSIRQSATSGGFSFCAFRMAARFARLAAFSSSVRLGGFRAHLVHRTCWQLGHSLAEPKTALHLWHVRRTRMRIGFSIRRASPSVECQSLFGISKPNLSPSFLARSSNNCAFGTLTTPSRSCPGARVSAVVAGAASLCQMSVAFDIFVISTAARQYCGERSSPSRK